VQKDMFESNKYYYDLIQDSARLGHLCDTLKEGDTFMQNGTEYEIIESRPADQCWLVQDVGDGFFNTEEVTKGNLIQLIHDTISAELWSSDDDKISEFAKMVGVEVLGHNNKFGVFYIKNKD